MRVLVIEDEYLVGLDIIAALEDGGFPSVEYVATLGDALRRIQNERWDAVVADANLNGVSIESAICALEHKRIPFIIVTGYERTSLPSSIRKKPLLNKPFTQAQLVLLVRGLLAPA